METSDWRARLQADHRQRIIRKIIVTLNRHLPVTGQKRLHEIAQRFEQKIYSNATSQSEYQRKIALKMLTLETSDWKARLQPDYRQRIFNKIVATLKRQLLVNDQEGLHELSKVARRFEEKIYTDATSQSDYLRKISWTLESKCQNTIAITSDRIARLPHDYRQRIVNKMVATLKRQLLVTDQEGLHELSKFAQRFEEMIYTNATCQFDYLRKISWKMLTLDSKCQNTMASPSDWRARLQPDYRQRNVNKIVATLKRLLLVTDQEGLHELSKVAQRFEEKIYTDATSQFDYLTKISWKMLTLDSKCQNTMVKPSDWRARLQPVYRQRIVKKIMYTLKRHLLVTGRQGLHELSKVAQRFEAKIYTDATSQTKH